MPNANQWLRLWHDMPNDPKFRTIAKKSGQSLPNVLAVYINLLVDASRNVTRGHVDVTAEDLSSALDLSEDDVSAILEAMQGRVLDGNHLTGWENRQPKREDLGSSETGAKSAAERKRDQREREKQNESTGDVTGCHEESRNVTLDKEKSREEVNPTSSLRSEGEQVAGSAESNPNESETQNLFPEIPEAEAEVSLQASIFEIGLPAMVAGGCSEKSARSLLGKLRKDLGDLDALVAVEAMAREQPADAAAWVSAAIKARVTQGKTFDAWRDDCKARGEALISDYQPVLSYCQGIGLPSEWLNLAWAEFRRQHGAGGLYAERKSEDWRRSFRASIERNFLRLWFRDSATGTWALTTAGQQAEATHEADRRASRKPVPMQEAA